jgi:hypothetical protein
MNTPLTTKAGVQIGAAWRPVEMPRELTYEELWTQRLLLGENVLGSVSVTSFVFSAGVAVACVWAVLAIGGALLTMVVK